MKHAGCDVTDLPLEFGVASLSHQSATTPPATYSDMYSFGESPEDGTNSYLEVVSNGQP